MTQFLLFGPPFPTGNPHYGHLANFFIKDTLLGYNNNTSKVCFDVHGLPTELKIEKDFKTDNIKLFNNRCNDYINDVTKEWYSPLLQSITPNIHNSTNKTSDKKYMKSTHELFKILFEKGLIYKTNKILPYSASLQTTISNFEATQNYKSVTEKSIYVLFESEDEDELLKTYFLVWTTTPFTLPFNASLCINENIDYIYFVENDKKIVCSKFFFENKLKKDIETFPYYDFSVKYKSLFNKNKNNFSQDCFVKEKVGTGIVHLSPIFGEDDYRVCKRFEIPFPNYKDMIDNKLTFTYNLLGDEYDIKDKELRDCNNIFIKYLKNSIYMTENITHDIMMCWRTDKPLYYFLSETISLDIQSIKKNILSEFEKINFVNCEYKEKMRNEIKEAPDWCLSRKRKYGLIIPLYTDEGNNLECNLLNDIYYLEDVPLDYKKHCGYVFDCWFESGSQFFFEKKHSKIVIEGSDQTKGWFYTLLVLGVALFNRCPYENIYINGTVLTKDGVKFSKKLNNYKPIEELIKNYDTDSIRLYFLSSPLTKGISFKFDEECIKSFTKNIIIPIKNVLTLYSDYSKTINLHNNNSSYSLSSFDKWILYKTNILQNDFSMCIKKYDLNSLSNLLLDYIKNSLKGGYCKFNRETLKGKKGIDEARVSLNVLGSVLVQVAIIIKHLTPKLSEFISNELNCKVMLCPYFTKTEMNDIDNLYKTIYNVFKYKTINKIPLKQPLESIIINIGVIIPQFREIFLRETNIEKLIEVDKFEEDITYKPNYKNIKIKSIQDSILRGEIDGIKKEFYTENKNLRKIENYNIFENNFYIYSNISEELKEKYCLKLLLSEIQKFKKEKNIKPFNEIKVYYNIKKEFKDFFIEKKYKELIEYTLKEIPIILTEDNEYDFKKEIINYNIFIKKLN